MVNKEYESLKLKIFKQEKLLNQCRELIIDIEWIWIDGEFICLFCKGNRTKGHSDCDLARVKKSLDEQLTTSPSVNKNGCC